MPLILRSTKDSALSFTEMDGNFSYLDTRLSTMMDSHGLRKDSAFIQAITSVDSTSIRATAKLAVDSAHVKGIVDASYVQSIQSTKDSSFITGIVDSDYITSRADRSVGNFDTLNADNIRGISNLASPHTDTPKSFIVVVASKDTTHRYEGLGSGSGYKVDGVFSPFITLTPGRTYRFDQSDASNSMHPLHFYYKSDKSTGEYTTGVTRVGTAGQAGAYVQIQVGDDTPTVLHYQCYNHAYMGNSIHAGTRNLAGYNTDDLVAGTQNEYYTAQKVKNILGSVDLHIVPDVDDQRDLGSSIRKFRDLYLSGNTLHLGTLKLKDSAGRMRILDTNNQEATITGLNRFDSNDIKSIIDSAHVRGIQADLQRDSSFITNIVDSNYVAIRTGSAMDSGTTTAIINSVVNTSYIQSKQLTFLDSSLTTQLVDSAYVNARADTSTYGNSDVISLIDSAYVTARAGAGTDSAAVIALIDTTHVQARQDKSFASLTGKPTTLAGYGISDGSTFSGQFSALTGKPTTIAGYGITDAFDGAFGSLTGKPSLFSTIASSGQNNIVADGTADILYIEGGSGISIATDQNTDTLTITANETSTLNDVVGRGGNSAYAMTLTAGLTVSGGLIADSIGNGGLGFGSLSSASDIQLDAAGDINALSNKITNVGTPVSSGDATNKTYVDTTAITKGSNDIVVARLAALQYTSTTEAAVALHGTPLVSNSPNVTYTVNADNISVDTAGFYKLDFGTTIFANASDVTHLTLKAQKVSGGVPTDIARTATYGLYDSSQVYEYHQFGISAHVQLGANDGVRVLVDQIGGGTNENYMDDYNITSSYPGSTTLTVTKVG